MNKLVVVASNFGQKNKNKKSTINSMTSNEMNALDTQYSQFACPGPFCWAFQYRFFNFL